MTSVLMTVKFQYWIWNNIILQKDMYAILVQWHGQMMLQVLLGTCYSTFYVNIVNKSMGNLGLYIPAITIKLQFAMCLILYLQLVNDQVIYNNFPNFFPFANRYVIYCKATSFHGDFNFTIFSCLAKIKFLFLYTYRWN